MMFWFSLSPVTTAKALVVLAARTEAKAPAGPVRPPAVPVDPVPPR